MATRITKAVMDDTFEFADGIPKTQVKMIGDWKENCINYYRGRDIIAPIIAKNNRFDGEIAET